MKKYLTISVIILAFSLKAQFSLTKAINEPVLGDVNTKQIYDSAGVVPKAIGVNQIWDFSGFIINPKIEVSNYISASAAGGDSYSGTTIVESFDQTYFFMKATSSTYEIVGIQNPNFKLNFSSNTASEFIWPVSIGYSNNDSFSGTANANNLNGTVSGNISTSAQGSGTLIIPGGITFSNVLQVKMRLTASASFAFGLATANLKVVEYTYYDSLYKFPLVTVSYFDATGAYTAHSAAIKINSSIVGINDYSFDSMFNVFPNPAKNSFNIKLNNPNNSSCKVEIINSFGKTIRVISLGNMLVISDAISIADLASGIYIIKTTLGDKVSTRKLIKE